MCHFGQSSPTGTIMINLRKKLHPAQTHIVTVQLSIQLHTDKKIKGLSSYKTQTHTNTNTHTHTHTI